MKHKQPGILLKAGAVALAATCAGPAFGTNRYVDASVSSSGDGLGWTTAKKTIQEAVSGASSGDEIRVAQGTYKPASQSTSIELADAVRIKCGFVGNANSSNPNLRDPSTYITILSGDLGGGTHS